MKALVLTAAERREHRARAHHLDPVAMIGSDGLTPAVVREVDAALKAHGLVKVRALVDDRTTREQMLAGLADALGAAPVQHIGKLLVLWRPPPPAAEIPRDARQAGARVVKVVRFSRSGNHRATVERVRVLGNERLTAGGLVKRAKVRAHAARTGVKKKAGG
ncbi:MAG: YhbY family RNA-binding protein [Pseudomonadota bacterium]|jgi:RNA-binding protein|nr:YhbY family RNA-binding protein [Rubrivivax sp.]MCA3257655.1 YhbY family RNA-binding protein [Rubrivivax sp.]MCE2911216.1 YhbY family RNA-binding protein [Rubrivivax sp.]MCZ8030031.1 YhbY family RNA-binding protein [Rubrivivax sp.]